MADQNKPSIVFAHGLWADGSCFQKLIPALQADGHEVMCSQHGLDSLKGDVECVTRSWPLKIAPSNPNCSASLQSAWAPQRSSWAPVTSRCSPSHRLCWT